MKTFRSRWIRYGSAVLYILLSFLSFYCACYKLPVGLKYGINLVVFAWACAAFFVSPQFEHALFCLRFFVLFFFPYLMFWMWSAGIWITEFQSWPYILRGSQNIIYMLTNLLYVIGAVYLFDEDATTYTLISMAFANFAVFVQVGLRTGFPRLISEYITLLLTFADDTGGAVRQMELHDMVYGWGTYVVYYMIHRSFKGEKDIWKFIISIFFFTLAMKRVAIPGAMGAVIFYWVMKWFVKRFGTRPLRGIITLITVVSIAGLFGYLMIIRSGLFIELAERYDVDLMSRDRLWTFYQDIYWLSPTYLGKGIRFIYNYGSTHMENMDIPIAVVHNVFLELNIETGFWCWIVWLFYELSFRVKRLLEIFDAEAALGMMAMNVYVFSTYLTDNTSFYFPINVTYRLVMMTWCYEILRYRQKKVVVPVYDD